MQTVWVKSLCSGTWYHSTLPQSGSLALPLLVMFEQGCGQGLLPGQGLEFPRG